MRHKLHCPVCYEKFNQKRYNHNASGCFYKKTNIACNFCGEEHKITECAQFQKQTSSFENRPRFENYPTSRDSEYYPPYPPSGNVDEQFPYRRSRRPVRPEGFHPYQRNVDNYRLYQRTFGGHSPYPEDIGHRAYQRGCEAHDRRVTGHQEYRVVPSSRPHPGRSNVFPREPLVREFQNYETHGVWSEHPLFEEWSPRGRFPTGPPRTHGDQVERSSRHFRETRGSPFVREGVKRQYTEEAREESVETGQIDDLFKDILEEE